MNEVKKSFDSDKFLLLMYGYHKWKGGEDSGKAQAAYNQRHNKTLFHLSQYWSNRINCTGVHNKEVVLRYIIL